MKFLTDVPRISFLYNGKNFEDCMLKKEVKERGNELITVYILENGLKLTNIAKKYTDYGAYEWVSWLENISDRPTSIISDLWDCDCEFPLEEDAPAAWTAYLPDPEKATKILVPRGSDNTLYDFYTAEDNIETVHDIVNHIFPGQVKEYHANNGHSSSKSTAPFFNIHRQGKGYIGAIGWSGQWFAKFTRTDSGIRVQTKVEDTNFMLYPGEKIRTSSIVLMPYIGSIVESQNKWRRLVKDHFSLIGQPGREEKPPFCAGLWGGMSSQGAIERIKAVAEHNLPFEYFWMDAGWYGTGTEESPDEFEGDWYAYTGDWRVNPNHHPNALQDVVAEIKKTGKKFLLWFEPERVCLNMPIVSQHPEYFLDSPTEEDENRMLNLGNPEAWDYCVETMSDLIQELHVSCFRQDFNFEPIEFWRRHDAPYRKGITEIKYVMGFYRFWDTLLERFPHLLIDNCAGGGRRIDIETMRRSIPLWRSDAQCPANFPPEYSQNHNITYSTWLPYSGTSAGRNYDVYQIRSSYAPAMTTNYTFSERNTFGDDVEKMEILKKCMQEYLKVRPYFLADMYPLTEISDKMDCWCAVQYNRPESDDGMVQVFRRPKSAVCESVYPLAGISADRRYRFTDADDNSVQEFDGKELIENGFPVRIATRRTAKIYFYEVI